MSQLNEKEYIYRFDELEKKRRHLKNQYRALKKKKNKVQTQRYDVLNEKAILCSQYLLEQFPCEKFDYEFVKMLKNAWIFYQSYLKGENDMVCDDI